MATEQTRINVYARLSISKADVLRVLPTATVSPPVRRDDILRDIKNRTHVVVIIDGVFQSALAIAPAEIVDALRTGVRVYGASSMGALRAAELESLGMVGHGAIFKAIHSSTEPFRDDYLGQTFWEDEGQVKSLSRTFVDFEFNLRRLLAKGRLDRAGFDTLVEAFRACFYPQRTYSALVAKLGPSHPLLSVARKALDMRSQKHIDAVGVLRKVKFELRRVARLNAGPFAIQHTSRKLKPNPARSLARSS